MNTLVIANWKLNPTSPRDAKKLFTGIQAAARAVKGVQTVVCPPTVFLAELAKEKQVGKVQLGVQDVFPEAAGAHTGETSPVMVQAYKARWAIVGHSERRALGETNELVGKKVRAAMLHGITPVLCVGESVRTDEGEYYTFVREQLESALQGVKRKDVPKLVIAYEPVWAIGERAQGACSPAQLYEMMLFIKKLLIERCGRKLADQVAILYGGSVKPDNAAALVREGGVQGLLVGSASCDAAAFGGILSAVSGV